MAVNKEKELLDVIQSDLLGCDLKLSLFISSQLYLFESCCVPFPPKFIKDGQKQINELSELLNNIPDFDSILSGKEKLSDDVIELLYWLFIELKGPKLESVPREDFHDILSKSKQVQQVPTPTHIFSVTYWEGSTTEARFQEHAAEFPTAYAFHGTKLQNFHNIIHHSLQQHLNKNSLFGEGLYLSTEMNVSLPYSRNGTGWNKSILGPTLAAVALCEYIDHPVSVIKCSKEVKKKTDLPEKYVIVQNNDIVRVRYLVVYATGRRKQQEAQGLLGIFLNHKFLFVFYFLVLILIGCSNSRYVDYLKKKFYRQLSTSIEDLRMLFSNR